MITHTERQDKRMRHYLGAEIMALVADPKTCEISVNPGGEVFVTKSGGESSLQERVGSLSEPMRESFIYAVADVIGAVIDRDSPSLSAELPDREPWRQARFQAQLKPAAKGPMFSLRFHAREVYDLESYVKSGIMTVTQAAAISQALLDGESFMFAGVTFSGKTTLFNAALLEVARLHPKHRQVLIEDTFEVQLSSDNVVQLHTHGKLTMRALLRDAMRLVPNGVFIGEVRGDTMQAFLESLGTGHYGGCTIHATTTIGALRKAEDYVRQDGQVPDPKRIAEAINLVVVLRRDETHPAKRVVTEVSRISPTLSPSGEYQYERIT